MNGVAPIDQVQPSRFICSMACAGRKSCCSTVRPPRIMGEMRPWKNPVAWLSGDAMNMTASAVRSVPFTNDRSEKMRLLCVNSTALGLPVVPDVDRMQATSSDVMGGGYSIGS